MPSRFTLLVGLACVWGLSEATIFFIVPDVIISFIALEYGYRKGLIAAVASVVGAVLGGALMFAWGHSDIVGARAFFVLLPAIAPSTIARASAEVIQPNFALAMLKGSLTGVPFKLYASEAGAMGISLGVLIALTPLVRLPRFMIAASLAALAHHWAPKALLDHKFKLMAGFWIVFYTIFWLNAAW